MKEKLKPTSLSRILDYYDVLVRMSPGEETKTKIAAALGVDPSRVVDYERRPEYKLAREKAESRRGNRKSTFAGYIFNRLSADAKDTWNAIQFWSEHEDADTQIDKILAGKCTRLRQEIFIHALVNSNFKMAEACRLAGVSVPILHHWKNTDLAFRQLVEEIQIHKKNFFEDALMELVEQKHPAAILFVNRTVNADRGYSEKLEIEQTGSGSVEAGGFPLEELDLDRDTLRKVLDAVKRAKQRAKAGNTSTATGPVYDAEVVSQRTERPALLGTGSK